MNLDQVLLDFGKKSAKGAFPNIDRTDVVAGLKKRIAPGGAQNIDQGASSLCGPAAVMFCVASRNPEMYVQYVTDLYDQGQAKFGTLPVTPSPLCRNYSPKMDAADWIALASLRDSDNKILNYSSVENEAAGITMPKTVAAWLSQAGYNQVYESTQWFGAMVKTRDHIMRAANARRHGRDVCLFVNWNMVLKGSEGDLSVTPNHWIVLTQARQIDTTAGKVALEVYCWGTLMKVPRTDTGEGDLDDVLKNYYGFVSAL